jgi:hypothetical protein
MVRCMNWSNNDFVIESVEFGACRMSLCLLREP